MKPFEMLACLALGAALRGRLPAEGALAVYLAALLLLHHQIRRTAFAHDSVSNRLKVLAAFRLVLLGALAGSWTGLQLTPIGVPAYALAAGLAAWLPLGNQRFEGLWELRRQLQLAFRREVRVLLALTLAGALVRPDLTLWLATQAGMVLMLSLPWAGLLWATLGGVKPRWSRESRLSRAGRSLCRITGAAMIGSLPLWALLTDWHPSGYLLGTLAFVLVGSPWRTPRHPKISLNPPPAPCENPTWVAAIVLMSFPPELSAQIFKELGPEAVQKITLEISKLPQIKPHERAACMDGFVRSADWHHARSTGARLEGQADYERLIWEWPAEAGRLMRLVCSLPEEGATVPTTRPAARSVRQPGPGREPLLASPARAALKRGLACGLVSGLTLSLLAGQSRSLWLSAREALAASPSTSTQAHLQRFLDRSLGGGQAALGLTPDGCVVTVTGDHALAGSLRGLLEPQLPAGTRLTVMVLPERAGLDYTLPLALTALAGVVALIGWRQPLPGSAKPVKPVALEHLEQAPIHPDLVPLLSIEMGPELHPFLKSTRLSERIRALRQHVSRELGLILPPITCSALLVNPCSALLKLPKESHNYVIKLRGAEVARGEVRADKFLTIGPEDKLQHLEGQKTVDPTYGMPGRFIEPRQRGDAERLGCVIFDPISIIAVHLTEVVRAHAHELLGLQELDELLRHHLSVRPALRHAVDVVGRVSLRAILRGLLAEEVSIRDLPGILERLAEHTLRPDMLTTVQRIEDVRYYLRRTICESRVHSDRRDLHVLRLECPADHPNLRQWLGDAIQRSHEEGCRPVLVCPDAVRAHVSRQARRWFPLLTVLAWGEIEGDYNLTVITAVTCSKD